MTESTGVVQLAAAQKEQAGQMLARAFQEDPVYTSLFPDAGERVESLAGLFGAVVSYSLVYGCVHSLVCGRVHGTARVEGAACWLTPGNTEVTFWRMLRTKMELQRAVARFDPQVRRRFLGAMGHMDRSHKRLMSGDHWYLWALGVEPECQGQGIGGRLLQPALAQADREGVPCYLETQTEQNVAFYQKRGFAVVYEGQVLDGSVKLWSMLREPGQ